MNHYETVFILNPVYLMFKTVSKFEDFLTSRGTEWYLRDWGLKRWHTKSKQKKSGFTICSNSK
jgi:ribosomal protein S6